MEIMLTIIITIWITICYSLAIISYVIEESDWKDKLIYVFAPITFLIVLIGVLFSDDY